MEATETMHKDISDSIANMIDIQELAGRHNWMPSAPSIENENMIKQEAGKIIQALSELENLLPETK